MTYNSVLEKNQAGTCSKQRDWARIANGRIIAETKH